MKLFISISLILLVLSNRIIINTDFIEGITTESVITIKNGEMYSTNHPTIILKTGEHIQLNTKEEVNNLNTWLSSN